MRLFFVLFFSVVSIRQAFVAPLDPQAISSTFDKYIKEANSKKQCIEDYHQNTFDFWNSEENKGFFVVKILSFLTGSNLNLKNVCSNERSLSLFHCCEAGSLNFGDTKEDYSISLKEDLFKSIRLLHIDTRLFSKPKLLHRLAKKAKENNLIVSLDLSSPQHVKQYKDELLNFLPDNVDIVFANESEAFELSHLNPQEACDFLASLCGTSVVTLGEKGSWARSGKIKLYTPASSNPKVPERGYGSLYAAGFLLGYLENEPIQKCTQLGSSVAAEAVFKNTDTLASLDWNKLRTLLTK